VLGRKGRPHRGTLNSSAKLTDKQVYEIRARYKAGGIKQTELADEFGVTQPMISQIILGKAWSHISA